MRDVKIITLHGRADFQAENMQFRAEVRNYRKTPFFLFHPVCIALPPTINLDLLNEFYVSFRNTAANHDALMRGCGCFVKCCSSMDGAYFIKTVVYVETKCEQQINIVSEIYTCDIYRAFCESTREFFTVMAEK